MSQVSCRVSEGGELEAQSVGVPAMTTKPAPKAANMHNRGTGKRPGSRFSPFVDMRGKIYGTWLVNDYLYAEDHLRRPRADPDTGVYYESEWTEYWWICTCLVCRTTAAIERRQIRGKTPVMCQACKTRAALKERARRRDKEASDLKAAKVAAKAAYKAMRDETVIKMTKEGKTQCEIGKVLDLTHGAVGYWQKALGLKAARPDPHAVSRARNDEVIARLTKAGQTQEEIAAALGLHRSSVSLRQKALGLTPMNRRDRRGRPLKYKTEEGRLEAVRARKRAAYYRMRARTGKRQGKRGRPKPGFGGAT
jgi:hypothetical protein